MPMRSFLLVALALASFLACTTPELSRARPHSDPADPRSPGAAIALPGQALATGLQASHRLDSIPPAPLPRTRDAKSYTCPMHPNLHMAQPGQCPDCGMRLVPESTPAPAKGAHP